MPAMKNRCGDRCQQVHRRCRKCRRLAGPGHENKELFGKGLCASCFREDYVCRICGKIETHRLTAGLCARDRARKESARSPR